MNLNRFKQLLESQIGNVKPLISEQSKKLKDIYKKYFQNYYQDGTNELKIPEGTGGSVYNTYEMNPNEFWNSFDEYFNGTQITPPTKVYIGDKEIIRP